MPTALQAAIHRLAEQFSEGILRAVRAASLEELQSGAPSRRTPGRPRGSVRTEASSGRKGPGRPRKSIPTGASPGADVHLDKLVETVKKNPMGIRSEDLRAALGMEKVPFRTVAAVAVEANLIRRTGEKRATTFLPK